MEDMHKHFTKTRTTIELLLLFCLSLVPFNWLPGDTIIAGHDAGIPLNPVGHFIDRLYMWTERWGMGSDQSLAAGGFIIHGLEALIYSLVSSIQLEQKIYFVIWLLIPGLTMYYMLRSLFTGRYYMPLIGAMLYMVNHFLLQGWFVAERTKFSVYAALPLVIVFMTRMYMRKMSAFQAGLLTALTVGILNGGGNIPLFGSLIVICIVTIGYFVWIHLSLRTIGRTLVYSATCAVGIFLLFAYWLIPYALFTITQFTTEVDKAGGIDGVIGWAKVISKNSSIINIIRLQGIPDWYENVTHAYASAFLHNPLLIGVSLLLPILAYGSWFFMRGTREKTLVLLFLLMSLVGVVFTAGMHAPTGIVYEALLRLVPGFIIFRTPFYKFAPIVIVPFAVLISLSLDELIQRVSSRFTRIGHVDTLMVGAVVFAIILYNYPILNGLFFDYEKDGRSTRITVPDYVYQFQAWADGQENNGLRSLQVPQLQKGNKLETYDWGYHSLSPLTTLLTRKSFVTNNFFLTATEDEMVWNLYDDIRNGTDEWEEYAKALGFSSILLRNDYVWNARGNVTRKPEEYTQSLTTSNSINRIWNFGKWDVYTLANADTSLISTVGGVTFVSSGPEYYRYLLSLPNIDAQDVIYFDAQNKQYYKDPHIIEPFISRRYYIPTCITCDLRKQVISEQFDTNLILPGSPFYRFIEKADLRRREQVKTTDKLVQYLLSTSLRKLLEVKRMYDLKNDIIFVPQGFLDHRNLISELGSIVKQYYTHDSEFNNSVLINAESYLELQKEILEQINVASGSDYEAVLSTSFSEVVSLKNEIVKNVWRTREENEKRYAMTVDEAGSYRLLLRVDRQEFRGSYNDLPAGKIEFYLDEELIAIAPQEVNTTWISLGEYDLPGGYHTLRLPFESAELFDNRVSLITGDTVEDVNESDEYRLLASGERSCLTFSVAGLQSDEIYRVTFDHKRSVGEQQVRAFITSSDEVLPILTNRGTQLNNSNDSWKTYLHDELISLSDTLTAYICSDVDSSLSDSDTIIDIKNISVRKISSPVLVFEQKTNIEAARKIDIPVQKINQTKYILDTSNQKDPFILLLPQQYNLGWRVYPAGPDSERTIDFARLWTTSVSDSFHLIGKGYANIWIIHPENHQKLVVEYEPQVLFYIASAVSIGTLLLIIGYLLTAKLYAKSKK